MKLRRITNSYNKFTEIIESTSGGKKLVKIRWPINVESLERQSYDLSLFDILGTQKDHTCSTFSSPPILQSQKDEGAKLNLFSTGVTSKLFSPANGTVYSNSYKPFLVADSAYSLLPWVMKPYGGRLTREMANFNKKLSCERVSVKHAFGQLKGRWRCLLKANDSKINNIKTQVLACCVLHNICKECSDEFIDGWNIEELENVEDGFVDTNQNLDGGKKMRKYQLDNVYL
ncbi:putative nuclease HARBI1 [Trichonephila clavipes]|nr:putative nuclease HARBI1 [Trichonephila clavipes]